MKKFISHKALMLLFFSTLFFSSAQSQNNATAISANELQAPEFTSVKFLITIPDADASRIVRENGQDAVYYKFKKSNGGTVFLFQVNKISEYRWLQIKYQLSHPIILDHKNGFIYYALKTDTSHLKGEDHDAYDQVYNRLNLIISSIVITDTGDN